MVKLGVKKVKHPIIWDGLNTFQNSYLRAPSAVVVVLILSKRSSMPKNIPSDTASSEGKYVSLPVAGFLEHKHQVLEAIF